MVKSLHKFSLFIAVLLVSTQSFAWTKEDTAWESAYLMAHIADWGQTRDIASQCGVGTYAETNPLLGSCPETNWVNTYFMATALAHVALTTVLPKKYRRMFQVGTLAMEIGYVSNNASIGLRASF